MGFTVDPYAVSLVEEATHRNFEPYLACLDEISDPSSARADRAMESRGLK
jgi:hypothetical protein